MLGEADSIVRFQTPNVRHTGPTEEVTVALETNVDGFHTRDRDPRQPRPTAYISDLKPEY